jgi:hypothetical protein
MFLQDQAVARLRLSCSASLLHRRFVVALRETGKAKELKTSNFKLKTISKQKN